MRGEARTRRSRGMNPVSDCCTASLRIAGRVLTYWTCRECGEACEAVADSGEETAVAWTCS